MEYPSLRDPDAEIEITPDAESRLADWGRTWNASGEETLVDYRDLVDKCIILEAKRLALRERLLVAQAKYLAAVMLELSAGREKEAKEIYSVVEVLDRSGAELNSYQTDDNGLIQCSGSMQPREEGRAAGDPFEKGGPPPLPFRAGLDQPKSKIGSLKSCCPNQQTAKKPR